MADTPQKRYTSQERLKLIQQLTALPQPMFEQIVFALGVPRGNITDASPLGQRAAALLNWAQSSDGPGLKAVETIYHEILGEQKQSTSAPASTVSASISESVSMSDSFTASQEPPSSHPSQRQQVSTTPRLIVTRHRAAAQSFIENLADGIDLEMVLIQGSTFLAGMSALGENVPNGVFMMGSPDDETDRYDDEGPQHEVTVPTFFMGKFPVTQAQWRVVAETYPQVDRTLDPDPANFKGANRPVEQLSWQDTVEFCARLLRRTGRTYRLPSEAEWEYACRAGTTTPFHFGETITTDLANYDGTGDEEGAYGRGPKGIYRKETTDVGSLRNANAFGLYDMHGNVWEWCLDHWHDNYEGEPPTDGSAWVFPGEEMSGDRRRVLRGGSWNYYPRLCRSACRDFADPDARDNHSGLRVVCAVARTP